MDTTQPTTAWWGVKRWFSSLVEKTFIVHLPQLFRKTVYNVLDESCTAKGAVLLAAALTHLHPGAGRSPGVVDLPVIRDPHGIFFVPGSSIKGSLKTMLARKRNCIKEDDGRIDCSRCRDTCCLLGGEVGEGSEAPSALSITDLYPLLVPLPSLDRGFVYATSPLLVARAKSIVEAAGVEGPLKTLVESISSIAGRAASEDRIVFYGSGDTVTVGVSRFRVESVDTSTLNLDSEEIVGLLRSLHPLFEAYSLRDRLIVVNDALFPVLLDRSIVRVTRVRLDRQSKTVGEGLWTEEYIPHATVFLGAVFDTGYRGKKYCDGILEAKSDAIEKLVSLLGGSGREASFALVVGGKESIGKGLLKVVLRG